MLDFVDLPWEALPGPSSRGVGSGRCGEREKKREWELLLVCKMIKKNVF